MCGVGESMATKQGNRRGSWALCDMLQHILGVAKVESRKGCTAGRIGGRWHNLPWQDAVLRKIDELTGVVEGQRHFVMEGERARGSLREGGIGEDLDVRE